MIYVTGDCHGNFLRFTRQQRKQLSYQFSEQDFIIICGDFGLLWRKNKETEFNIQWLSSLPPVILWVQGNHENYDMIAEYPAENWNGGKVRHIVRDRIILLERGQVFTIEGKQFFTFGGASSHDMPGGILDKDSPDFQKEKKRLKRKKLMYRVRNESWWEQELPTEEEMQEGRTNLQNVGNTVDYIITHCLSSKMQDTLECYYGGSCANRLYESDILTDYFEELEETVQYKKWFCGHYHVKLELDKKHQILYKDIICLDR